MQLHILRETITSRSFLVPSGAPSSGGREQRQATLPPINFWHLLPASALGMPGVKFGVAGLIFDPAKKILLQGLTYGRGFFLGGWVGGRVIILSLRVLFPCHPACPNSKICHQSKYVAGIISWLCKICLISHPVRIIT